MKYEILKQIIWEILRDYEIGDEKALEISTEIIKKYNERNEV